MKIIKRGRFEILTPIEELRAQLLRIERAGRTCYQSEKGEITQESAAKFIRKLLKSGHESVIEHSCLTVRFVDCGRGFTHELVRQRLCAFSQESTRYVDYAKRGEGPDLDRFQVQCIAPPHRDTEAKVPLEDGRLYSFSDMVRDEEMFYRALRKAGWVPEDARSILPTDLKAEIVITANFREWRHIFKMRTQKAAHWQIRQVMGDLLVELQRILPGVFVDFVEAGKDQNGLRFFKQVPIE